MSKKVWIIIVLVLVIAVAAGLYFGRNMFARSNDCNDSALLWEPESLRSDDTVVLSVDNQGEFAEVVVDGTIRDFQLVRLEWDDQTGDMVETEVIHNIGEIKDQTVVIKTYFPEGIPGENLKWQSTSGKEYDFIIQEEFGEDFPGYWEFICEWRNCRKHDILLSSLLCIIKNKER